MVDLKTDETPDKSLEVNAKRLEDKAGLNQFKDLSKTSAKSSYPEVVTESSHQVKPLEFQHNFFSIKIFPRQFMAIWVPRLNQRSALARVSLNEAPNPFVSCCGHEK